MEDGWTRYGSKWYGMSDMTMVWDDAKDFCSLHADGAELASVATAADFNNVITAVGGWALNFCQEKYSKSSIQYRGFFAFTEIDFKKMQL